MKKVSEGWKFVRFGLGDAGGNIFEPSRAVRNGIKFFEAVRNAVGDDIEICLDIHTRLDPHDTITLCKALEQYNPYFLEDPIRKHKYFSSVTKTYISTDCSGRALCD